jgi:hypothetical protein
MKHLKKFNEATFRNIKQELEEFCNWSLATLLDNGFRFGVQQSYIGYYDLQIDNYYRRFTWDDVKDYLIPFFQVLNDKYEISNFDLPKHQSENISVNDKEIKFDFIKDIGFSPSISYDDVVSDQITDPLIDLMYLRVRLKISDKVVNENIYRTHQEGLKDFCDDYLAYLYDDGFSVEFLNNTQLNFIKTSKWGEGSNHYFNWYDVKDSMLPFLIVLDETYKIDKICFNKALGSYTFLKEGGHDLISDIPSSVSNFLDDNIPDRFKRFSTNLIGSIVITISNEFFTKHLTKI